MCQELFTHRSVLIYYISIFICFYCAQANSGSTTSSWTGTGTCEWVCLFLRRIGQRHLTFVGTRIEHLFRLSSSPPSPPQHHPPPPPLPPPPSSPYEITAMISRINEPDIVSLEWIRRLIYCDPWNAYYALKGSGTGYFPSFPATGPYVTAVGATMGSKGYPPNVGQAEIGCESNINRKCMVWMRLCACAYVRVCMCKSLANSIHSFASWLLRPVCCDLPATLQSIYYRRINPSLLI